MKIYTKTGDKGQTSLFGGKRVSKAHTRVDAYGNIDELNAYLGLLRDLISNEDHKATLLKIQNELFVVGSHLATPPEQKTLKSGKNRLTIESIEVSHITYLEQEIDQLEQNLPKMTHFILPGGHVVVSTCHVARNICRRAERSCVKLAQYSEVEEHILTYLNRLSDYLFVLARKLAFELQIEEIKWNVT
jgi:cob(I)alamin adenosyltransferase